MINLGPQSLYSLYRSLVPSQWTTQFFPNRSPNGLAQADIQALVEPRVRYVPPLTRKKLCFQSDGQSTFINLDRDPNPGRLRRVRRAESRAGDAEGRRRQVALRARLGHPHLWVRQKLPDLVLGQVLGRRRWCLADALGVVLGEEPWSNTSCWDPSLAPHNRNILNSRRWLGAT